MRALLAQIFATGVMVIGCGVTGLTLLSGKPGFAMLQGALTLGGGLLICGCFALRSRWHGIIGAGVLSLLGAARGAGNLPDAFRYFAGDRPRGAAPLLELTVTAACLALLFPVVQALFRERARRLEEQQEKAP